MTRLLIHVLDTDSGANSETWWPAAETDFDLVESEALVAEGLSAQLVLNEARSRLGHIQMELKKRLEADGATEFVAPSGSVRIKEGSATYDQTKLDTLLELLAENELVEKGALTLAHEETVQVARKWNATKLKPFERRGQAVKDAMAAARIPGNPTVVIEVKNGN